MYIKYQVPRYRRSYFEGKKVLYGKVIQKNYLKYANLILYKVQYINYYNYIDVVDVKEVDNINLIDRIKIFFINLRKGE